MSRSQEPSGGHSQPSRRSNFGVDPMSLLARLMDNSLDPDYARAAARRQSGMAPPRWPARLLLFVVLAGVGVFAAVAVAQSRQQPITNDQRERLIEAIQERTARTDQLQAEATELRRDIDRMRAEQPVKNEREQEARERLQRLELAAGAVPVRGSGLTVTLDDAPPDEDNLSGVPPESGRVRDHDLQLLVNGLWAAGAEAVAVDGQRVTPLTAIRSAGKAILVNYRPLNPPYVVTAIGDPDAMRSELASSEVGRRFHTLQVNVGIRFDTEQQGSVRLPGASGLSLRYAREVDGG